MIANSNYPAVVKEAAVINYQHIRFSVANSVPHKKDGNFFGWEGVFNSTGSCYGNCEHVWNYEFATPFLFGELAMKMRNVEYNYGLWDGDVLMSFRVEPAVEEKRGTGQSCRCRRRANGRGNENLQGMAIIWR